MCICVCECVICRMEGGEGRREGGREGRERERGRIVNCK